MRLQPESEHPHGLSDREFDTLFTPDRRVVFAHHGYPWLIHRLTYRRTNHANLHVRGYKEEGPTTTPFDMLMLNDLDRYHLVMDVISHVGSLGSTAADLRQEMMDRRTAARAWTREHGEDLPEITSCSGQDEGYGDSRGIGASSSVRCYLDLAGGATSGCPGTATSSRNVTATDNRLPDRRSAEPSLSPSRSRRQHARVDRARQPAFGGTDSVSRNDPIACATATSHSRPRRRCGRRRPPKPVDLFGRVTAGDGRVDALGRLQRPGELPLAPRVHVRGQRSGRQSARLGHGVVGGAAHDVRGSALEEFYLLLLLGRVLG
jgi:hypothetical protein